MSTRASLPVSDDSGPRLTVASVQSTSISRLFVPAVALGFVFLAGLAPAQDEIEVAAHWSPYQAPTSYPEGTNLHIIVDGDTLWDLSSQYLDNPFLWPQLWDANRYISDPNLIYPGDPLQIPDLDVVRPEDVASGDMGPGVGPDGQPLGPDGGGIAGSLSGGDEDQGPKFYPAYEEQTIACAGYISDADDMDMRITGSEDGDMKVNLATDDIVYLNRGSNDGVSPGDRYYIQRKEQAGWGLDTKYTIRTGALAVIAAQPESALAQVTHSCTAINLGDYLLPYEPIPVPLLPVEPAPDRMTPETGEMRGEIVASLDDLASLGEGYLVSIDLGQSDGVVPGNVFTVFRYMYPGAPRKVLGELAILTVQERNATARIMESYEFMVVGDLIELK